MKKQKKLTSLLITAIMIMAVVLTLFALRDITSSEETAPQSRIVTAPLYTVKSVGERVCVFKNADENPEYYVDEISLAALKVHDRELLKVGIDVYSADELSKLIEDFES